MSTTEALTNPNRERCRSTPSTRPGAAPILVDDPNGPRVVERRDATNTGTDETNWYDLGAPDTDRPMNFDTAIGVTYDTPGGYEFYRLYTQDEVDDLLDAAIGL